MEGGIFVLLYFEFLDCVYVFDFVEVISVVVDVGLYDVDVEEVDEILLVKIVLELDGFFYGGEFVLNLDVLIVDVNIFICCVVYLVWFGKG